jgi:hypothetical protein
MLIEQCIALGAWSKKELTASSWAAHDYAFAADEGQMEGRLASNRREERRRGEGREKY